MRLIFKIMVVLSLASASYSAFAEGGSHTRYRWTDSKGGVHFTDTLSPEALQLGYDVVDGQGLTLRHADRAKTLDEKKADAAALASQTAVKQRALNAAASDQQLLIAYATEADLAVAQKSKIIAIDQTIQNVQLSQSDQEKGLAEQLAHAAMFERDSKPVPAIVQQQIELLRKNIETQKAFVEHKQRERAELELKADAETSHYRALRAKKAAADAAAAATAQ